MAPAYAVSAMLKDADLDAAGLRLLRDPRGLRGAGAVHARGVGIDGVLPRAPAARQAARHDRPREAEPAWQQHRDGPSVRRDRRAHPRHRREAVRGTAECAARPDLGVHGGRHGRHGHRAAGHARQPDDGAPRDRRIAHPSTGATRAMARGARDRAGGGRHGRRGLDCLARRERVLRAAVEAALGTACGRVRARVDAALSAHDGRRPGWSGAHAAASRRPRCRWACSSGSSS